MTEPEVTAPDTPCPEDPVAVAFGVNRAHSATSSPTSTTAVERLRVLLRVMTAKPPEPLALAANGCRCPLLTRASLRRRGRAVPPGTPPPRAQGDAPAPLRARPTPRPATPAAHPYDPARPPVAGQFVRQSIRGGAILDQVCRLPRLLPPTLLALPALPAPCASACPS
ncbi:hypothetical protein GCM10027091_08730 [Streptomyces daliensis]